MIHMNDQITRTEDTCLCNEVGGLALSARRGEPVSQNIRLCQDKQVFAFKTGLDRQF